MMVLVQVQVLPLRVMQRMAYFAMGAGGRGFESHLFAKA
jgi:hypothetical protein